MQSNQITLSVESTDGRKLRSFNHEGRFYVESPEDREYQLRVKNKTGGRIKAVISVDSLNIVTGKPATGDKEETGYILNAYEEQIFKGYRVDNDTVAKFKFVKREKSYATEKGEGHGNGVIAVRAFAEKQDLAAMKLKWFEEWQKNQPKEKETIIIDRPYPVYPRRPWYWEDYWGPRPYWGTTCEGHGITWGGSTTLGLSTNEASVTSTMMNCATTENSVFGSSLTSSSVNVKGTLGATAMCAQSEARELKAASFDMGSGWGEAAKDSVHEVQFETGEALAEVVVYYASLESLKAMGVNVDRAKAVAFPEPFKREFAQPPSGWKR